MKNRDGAIPRRSIYALAPIFDSQVFEVPIFELSYSSSRFVPIRPFVQTLKDQSMTEAKHLLMISHW